MNVCICYELNNEPGIMPAFANAKGRARAPAPTIKLKMKRKATYSAFWSYLSAVPWTSHLFLSLAYLGRILGINWRFPSHLHTEMDRKAGKQTRANLLDHTTRYNKVLYVAYCTSRVRYSVRLTRMTPVAKPQKPQSGTITRIHNGGRRKDLLPLPSGR